MGNARMENCVFCKIIAHAIPSKVVYENDNVLAFWDIHPKARIHILLVPKKHISSLNEATKEDTLVLGNVLLAAHEVAKKEGLEHEGFKLIANTGESAGQVVHHVHFHLLGGEDVRGKIV